MGDFLAYCLNHPYIGLGHASGSVRKVSPSGKLSSYLARCSGPVKSIQLTFPVSSIILRKLAPKPSAPAISSLDSSNGKVTAKWNAVTGATGYVVYYAKSKNGSYKKLGSTKDRTFTSKKLSGGRTYYIRIKAYIKTDNGNIYSGASNIKSVYVK